MENRSGIPLPNLQLLFLLVLGTWFIFNLVQSVHYVLADYSGLPLIDHWIVRTDAALFHGRMYLPVALSAVCCVGVWVILVWATYTKSAILFPVREAALLLAGSLMAWKGIASFIANPLQAQPEPFSSWFATLAAVNFAIVVACLAFAWRRSLLMSRLGITVFSLYLLDLLAAPFLRDVIATLLVAWALAAVALLWIVQEAASKTLSLFTAAVLAALCFWTFQSANGLFETSRVKFANAQIAASMLRNDVFDPAILRAASPALTVVDLEMLRDRRKSIFANGPDKWLGNDIQHLQPKSKPLIGKITRVVPVAGGLEIVGWADTTWLTDQHAVLFVDKDDRIAGFGRRPPAGFPAYLSTVDTPDSLAFIGFVGRARAVGELSVYVRTLHGKSLQPIEGKIVCP